MNPFEMPPLFCKGKLFGCTKMLCPRSNGVRSPGLHHILRGSLCDRCMCRVYAGDHERCCMADLRGNIRFNVRNLAQCPISLLLSIHIYLHASRTLAWRNCYSLPIVVFPLGALAVAIPVLLSLHAIQPTDDLHCDASHPIWCVNRATNFVLRFTYAGDDSWATQAYP
jgi:hypothetical protein